jgi:hypothetical protein
LTEVRAVVEQRAVAVADQLRDVVLRAGAEVDRAGVARDEAVVVADQAAVGVAALEQPVLGEALVDLERPRVVVADRLVEQRADLGEGVGEEVAAVELAGVHVALRVVHRRVELAPAGRCTSPAAGRCRCARHRLAGVGDDEVEAAVGRDVLDRAAQVGVQPVDAEHQVLDHLLLVADLELLVVHAAQARPRSPAVRPWCSS